MTDATAIYQKPAELLQNLIRFDTTNPPGNEAACVGYIAEHCRSLGIETQLYAKNPDRPNLVARIEGEGRAAPLLALWSCRCGKHGESRLDASAVFR